MSPQRIGFIGLGIMGASMAANLAKSGHHVKGWNRTKRAYQDKPSIAADGVEFVDSLADLADCPVIFTCVTDGDSVRSVLFGSGGVAHVAAPETLVIDTSTIAPRDARGIHTDCAAQSLRFVDAPVSGGDVGARNATLTVMVGGDIPDVQRALPLLSAIGKKVTAVGGPGAGQLTKVVNQIAVSLSIVAMTEALQFAENHGLDPQITVDIIRGGAAGSWALDNYAPRLLRGDMRPGFSSVHMLKDLRIASEELAADESYPGLALSTELFDALATHGGSDYGNHALLEAYRRGWIRSGL